MSDLVEKVQDAVRPHLYWEGGSSSVVARAAIRAVLAHFADGRNIGVLMTEAFDEAMDKFVETSVPYHPACASAIAAAMAAALKEMEL